MEKKKQFTVALENKPGELARLCRKLAKEKVNIEAISVINTQEMGLVRLVANNQAKAGSVLKNYNSAKEDVLLLTIPNRPGELESIAKKLAAEKINIEYTYGSSPRDGEAVLVLKVDDLAKAMEILS